MLSVPRLLRSTMEMEEEEPMDTSEELVIRIEELRAGVVNGSVDLFFDMSQKLDDPSIMRMVEVNSFFGSTLFS